VTLDVVDMPLSQVIDRIADAADRPIVASVSSATTVTLSLHEARWHDALDYLIATYHLQARLAGRILVIEEPPHVALEAQGASTASWLLLLARQGGLSIVLPGNLPGTVDAELHDVRFEDALRATARDQGLEVEPVR
jgi:type II secretory pathway component HofQ